MDRVAQLEARIDEWSGGEHGAKQRAHAYADQRLPVVLRAGAEGVLPVCRKESPGLASDVLAGIAVLALPHVAHEQSVRVAELPAKHSAERHRDVEWIAGVEHPGLVALGAVASPADRPAWTSGGGRA